MAKFFPNYSVAYNHAVNEARKYSMVIQLRKGKEYNKPGFYVNFAVQDPTKRYGWDKEGEFIKPTDPLAYKHIAKAGFGYDHTGQNFGRLTEDTPVTLSPTEHAKPGCVIAYRVSDALRMHITERAIQPLQS